jgi:hypothetical protein
MENVVEKKRFVISKGMVGKNLIIKFTNKKGDVIKYDHDGVYSLNQEKLESMECFQKYGNYTNSNNIPTWGRECIVE